MVCAAPPPCRVRHQGFTLVELMVIIVVLGIAAATLTTVSMRSAELSAGMLREQQALSLANAILSEVTAMPYTYCDPNDVANSTTATSPLGCAIPEALGKEPSENRVAPATPATRFDNVNDYNNLNVPAGALQDLSGNLISTYLPTLANCQILVGVAPQALPGILATDALRVTVTVNCTDQFSPVVVDAIRVRYAPNRAEF